MARPPEKTFAYGNVPYEERPFVCQECGKIVRWDTEPQLVEHYSEEPEALAKFEEYRGEPLADEIDLKPARNRPGGSVHQHLPLLVNREGKQYEQWTGGSMCRECGDKAIAQIAEVVARRNALRNLLGQTKPADEPPLAPQERHGPKLTEEDAKRFFELGQSDKEEKKD